MDLVIKNQIKTAYIRWMFKYGFLLVLTSNIAAILHQEGLKIKQAITNEEGI